MACVQPWGRLHHSAAASWQIASFHSKWCNRALIRAIPSLEGILAKSFSRHIFSKWGHMSGIIPSKSCNESHNKSHDIWVTSCSPSTLFTIIAIIYTLCITFKHWTTAYSLNIGHSLTGVRLHICSLLQSLCAPLSWRNMLTQWWAETLRYGWTNSNQPSGQQQVLGGEKHHRWFCKSSQIIEIRRDACLGSIHLGPKLLKARSGVAVLEAELVGLHWV